MNVSVLGLGAWGTALAKILSDAGHALTVWGHSHEHLKAVQATGRNEPYLPGILLPKTWRFELEVGAAIESSECVVVAVPSKAFRVSTQALNEYGKIVVSVTKGIEYDTGLTMCGILQGNAPRARLVALSGPSFALEVARGMPTAVVAASTDAEAAQLVQQVFHRPYFRVYTSPDPLGVELGGALKNVVAIAAGAGDGLGFGDNSKAALITRGIAEMRRLGVACGAQAETFSGLSGIGDLAATCYSRLSRNRALGERIGRGEKLERILAESVSIAEGYPTARSARHLAQKRGVSTPIIDEAYAILYEGKNAGRAVQDLTARDSKAED